MRLVVNIYATLPGDCHSFKRVVPLTCSSSVGGEWSCNIYGDVSVMWQWPSPCFTNIYGLLLVFYVIFCGQ